MSTTNNIVFSSKVFDTETTTDTSGNSTTSVALTEQFAADDKLFSRVYVNKYGIVTGGRFAEDAGLPPDPEFTGHIGLRVPAGTTDQRPTKGTAIIRYNTDLNAFEVYEAGAWTQPFEATNMGAVTTSILPAVQSSELFQIDVGNVSLPFRSGQFGRIGLSRKSVLLGSDTADGVLANYNNTLYWGGQPLGNQGNQGATGAQGSPGNQGVTGATGVQGPQGFVGPQGSQGTTGAQGNQGFQGIAGSQGVAGTQGPQGFTGAQGTQGNQGVIGAQGTQGNQGNQGSAGTFIVTTTLFVDCNRVDTYTATGTLSFPYKTLAAALATVTAATQIIMAPGSYTESVASYPAYPLVVHGNGSTLTLSVATTLTNNYTAYDLNVVAANGVTYSGATATTKFILRNGSRKGPLALTAGILDAQACTQTWNTTSDKVTVSGTGQLIEIACINTLPIVQNSTSSIVFVENCNWNTSRDSTYLIESSAGQISVANTVVANTSVTAGGGIYIHNAQTAAAPNAVANCVIGAVTAVNLASGATLYSKVATTGTATLTTAAAVPDLIGVSGLAGSLTPTAANTYTIGTVALDLSAIYARTHAGAGATTFGSTSYATTITGSSIALGQGQIQGPSVSQGTALSLVALTPPNILATAAFTLTLPTASATYKGMTWLLSSASYIITYSGTFKYSITKGTWTTISASTYATTAGYLQHWIYCDGSTWFVNLD